mmetsp:Transcript_9481/g.15532  ORF Transcript_9481/g.15532 Transcript_9481/m.15532 type:complete len:86 (+) Transcript_9481:1-258(+)
MGYYVMYMGPARPADATVGKRTFGSGGQRIVRKSRNIKKGRPNQRNLPWQPQGPKLGECKKRLRKHDSGTKPVKWLEFRQSEFYF